MFDEFEELRLAPMDIVEHEHERSAGRLRLEEQTDGPERLLRIGASGRQTDGLNHAVGDELSLVDALDHRGDPAAGDLLRIGFSEPGRLSHNLSNGPERDPLAVRETPSLEHQGALLRRATELLDETRFPDPRRTEDREELAPTIGDYPIEGLLQQDALAFAIDERGIEPPGVARRRWRGAQQTVASDRTDTLQRERARFLDLNGITHEFVGLVCEQDLAGIRRLLQTSRE